jgi:hypothetical protein
MKSLLFTILMFVTVAVPLAQPAAAQTADKRIKTAIPFDFVFAGKTFPAGDYTIVNEEPNVLLLRDSQHRAVAVAITRSVESSVPVSHAKLRFYNSGDTHVLMQVWLQDSTLGSELFRPKGETMMAKDKTVPVQAAAGAQP